MPGRPFSPIAPLNFSEAVQKIRIEKDICYSNAIQLAAEQYPNLYQKSCEKLKSSNFKEQVDDLEVEATDVESE